MANPWNRLRSTVGQERQQLGTIVTTNGDGTSQVLLVGGGEIRAIGDGYADGQPVFLQSGKILSAAPSVSFTSIPV